MLKGDTKVSSGILAKELLFTEGMYSGFVRFGLGIPKLKLS